MLTIEQYFDAAFWFNLPPEVRVLANYNLPQATREELVQTLKNDGFGIYMVNAIDEEAWGPYQWAQIAAEDGYTNGVPNITQIAIGDAGQFAAPGEPVEPGQLGPYPEPPAPMPEGWIYAPSVAELEALVAPGADIKALLTEMYPPFVAPII